VAYEDAREQREGVFKLRVSLVYKRKVLYSTSVYDNTIRGCNWLEIDVSVLESATP